MYSCVFCNTFKSLGATEALIIEKQDDISDYRDSFSVHKIVEMRLELKRRLECNLVKTGGNLKSKKKKKICYSDGRSNKWRYLVNN